MLYMLTDSTKYDKSLTEVGDRSHTLYFFMEHMRCINSDSQVIEYHTQVPLVRGICAFQRFMGKGVYLNNVL